MIHLLALATVFNMVCAGTESGPGAAGDYSIVYRVDLAQGLWCEGRCESVRDVVGMADDRLVLEERSYRQRLRALSFSVGTTINLSTGEHFSRRGFTASAGPGFRRVGRCERAEFTGFFEQEP